MKFTIRKASDFGDAPENKPPHNAAKFNILYLRWEIEITSLEELGIFLSDLDEKIILIKEI